jgi:hypothetical protein
LYPPLDASELKKLPYDEQRDQMGLYKRWYVRLLDYMDRIEDKDAEFKKELEKQFELYYDVVDAWEKTNNEIVEFRT